MPKIKQTKEEIATLKSQFEDVDEKRKLLAMKLCSQAEFMEKVLNELQEDIEKNGAILTSTNGNGFEVIQENPAQKSYNTMINRYTALMAKLIDMLPKDVILTDELTEFIGGGKA